MRNEPNHPDRTDFAPWRFGLLLAMLTCAAFPQVVLGIETFVARDYGFFVYPLAYFQKQCFWRGELPFWDPYNNCGVPFLAQWNTMPLYPPSLLYLLFPLNWSLGFFSLLHLWFAGMGMFFLARRWTGNAAGAALAGAAFAFNGFTLNLLMWPSHIATFSWMPWVVLCVERAWREGGRKIPVAAFVGALQMLAGGPETIFLTWLIILALWLEAWVRPGAARGQMAWRFPVIVLLVFCLSAVQVLPFLDLVAHAQRESGYTDLRWSMPRAGLANFLVPMAFGSTATEGIFFQTGQYWTSSYYLGMGTLWLALLGAACARERRIRVLVAIAVIALLCALGANTPFYPLIRRLVPQLSFITYPVKFVMVAIFAAPLLAAVALTRLLNSRCQSTPAAESSAAFDQALRRRLLWLGVLLLIATIAVILWTQLMPLLGETAHTVLLNGISRAVFLVIAGGLLLTLVRRGTSGLVRYVPLALIAVGWLDVLTHEPSQNPTVPPNVYQPDLIRNRLAMRPQPALGASRAMLSPGAALELTRRAVNNPKNNFLAKREGFCADVNLLDGVPKVDGFFSLTPRNFDALLSLIYNATNGNWSRLESFMGVSQYTSPTNPLAWQSRPDFLPLVTAGQKPEYLDETNTLWALGRNQLNPADTVFLPPATRSLVTASNSCAAPVTEVKFGNNEVAFQVDAPAPALAVVAQTYYHDWQAEVDGKPVPVFRANSAFQALPVPPGRHAIRLSYQDRAFDLGAAISVCAWINCAVACLAFRRRDSARREEVLPTIED